MGLILILFLKTDELFLAKVWFSSIFKCQVVHQMEDVSLQRDTSRSGQTDRQTDRTEFGTSSSGDRADDLMCAISKLVF